MAAAVHQQAHVWRHLWRGLNAGKMSKNWWGGAGPAPCGIMPDGGGSELGVEIFVLAGLEI